MKDVLVLGAGLVAGPLVRYLLIDAGYRVTVASRTVAKARALVGDHPLGRAIAFDISSDGARLDELVAGADLAVSLLPYTYHPRVAEHCVRHGCHLVTTSYVSDAMRALDTPAQEAGVLLLNEIGVDPGIDHMSAMCIIDGVHDAGGEIHSFRSFCGGLPAPDANDNPLGYKFSWSPRGVVLAGRNEGRYKDKGEIVEVANERLFATHHVTWIEDLGDLEAYPNRDSLPYIDLYGIPETHTMLRSTLRNLGWCDCMQKLNALGFFGLEHRPDLPGSTFREVMARLIGTEDTVGLEAALYLCEQGTLSPEVFHFLAVHRAEPIEKLLELLNKGDKDVTVVEMGDKLGTDIGPSSRWTVRSELRRLGCSIQKNTKAIGITPEGLEIESTEGPGFIPADSIVIAVGSRSDNQLANDTEGLLPERYTIGDAKTPRNLMDAIKEGFMTGLEI